MFEAAKVTSSTSAAPSWKRKSPTFVGVSAAGACVEGEYGVELELGELTGMGAARGAKSLSVKNPTISSTPAIAAAGSQSQRGDDGILAGDVCAADFAGATVGISARSLTTACTASANSVGVWKRSDGCLASARSMTFWREGWSPGIGGGGSLMCLSRTPIVLSPSKGTCAASIS